MDATAASAAEMAGSDVAALMSKPGKNKAKEKNQGRCEQYARLNLGTTIMSNYYPRVYLHTLTINAGGQRIHGISRDDFGRSVVEIDLK